MTKVLFFGDIMGRPGREALRLALPELKAKYQPELIVANVENLAHGKGVTPSTLSELTDLGVGVFTSGNHVFDKGELSLQCFADFGTLIRPSNYPEDLPGRGWCRVDIGGQKVLILNLNGQVFFEKQVNHEVGNPFHELDRLLSSVAQKDDIILIDFHAEATSEKIALGWYAAGRVSAVLGTHTHVATADAGVLPGGTAYITDIGMCGDRHSVIGAKLENSLAAFLGQDRFNFEVADGDDLMVNGVFLEIENGKATKIERIFWAPAPSINIKPNLDDQIH